MAPSSRRRIFSDWMEPVGPRHEEPLATDPLRHSLQLLAGLVTTIALLFLVVQLALGRLPEALLVLVFPAAALLAVFGTRSGRLTPAMAHSTCAALTLALFVLVDLNRDQTHLGIIWFLFVPLWAATTSGTRAMWLWTGASGVAVMVVALRADPADPLWNNLMTPMFTLAVLVVSSAAVHTLLWRSRQRERELERAAQRASDSEAEAHRAEEHKTRLLTTMSHELRSPLMGVLASAEVLMSGPTNPANAANVNTLVRSANSLVQILDSVLDLAKLGTGNLTVDHARFAIRPMVETVASLFIDHAALDNTRLIVRIHPSVPSEWQGDEAKVAQILTNLVANALRTTHQGEVVITAEPAQDKLRISVSDTGSGFSAEALETGFDPRDPSPTSSVGPWAKSGFGLSISNDLAVALGSRIEIDSVPGQGSRFWFDSCHRVEGCLSVGAATEGPRSVGRVSLASRSAAMLGRVEPWLRHWGFEIARGPSEGGSPATPIDLDTGHGSTNGSAGPSSGHGIDIRISDLARTVDAAFGFFSEPAPTIRSAPSTPEGSEIAIVDDSSDVREALAAMVESMGYTPLPFASGEDLLAWPGIGKVDAIFLDLTMPTLDGMQVLEQLRARPSTASTPICILSGSDGRAERAIEGGASTFLLKPVRLQTVREVLDELVGDKSPSPR